MTKLDTVATDIFAPEGIALSPAPERDYVWTHDPYMRSSTD
jgi:hypothetical protein